VHWWSEGRAPAAARGRWGSGSAGVTPRGGWRHEKNWGEQSLTPHNGHSCKSSKTDEKK